MRITQINAYEVAVPALQRTGNSEQFGANVWDALPKLIVEAQTDEGVVGLGEGKRPEDEAGLRRAAEKLRDVDLIDLCFQEPPVYDLSGSDLHAHERAERLLEFRHQIPCPFTISTLLLDLLGKRAGLPAYTLLGGAYRRRIAVDYWQGRQTPDDSARGCRWAKEHGFVGVKCKCSVDDDLVARAETIREACGPEFHIVFDPNERFYRPAEAVALLRRLASVGNVMCVEDPYPRHRLDWFEQLQRQAILPVALHTGYTPALLNAVARGAIDYANLSDTPWAVRAAGDLCWLAGVSTWHGSSVDFGILEAAYLHVCAATKSMSLPSSIFGRAVRKHNLITKDMIVEDGCMDVPGGCGLGVELDRDALDRYTQRKWEISFG